MMNNEALQCPVDRVLINENKVRIIAFLVLVSALLFILTESWLIIAFLLLDFFLRTFNLGAYSPLGFLADRVVIALKIKNVPVDRAPKRFAAGTGLVFNVLILLSVLLGLSMLATALTIVLVIFASLESFVGFCAGCYVYSILLRFQIL